MNPYRLDQRRETIRKYQHSFRIQLAIESLVGHLKDLLKYI